MEQHAQQAEMHVQLLQEANASLADERAALLQVIPDHICCQSSPEWRRASVCDSQALLAL